MDRAVCGGEAMLQAVQKLKLTLTAHWCVVGLPADPKHHYLECIFSLVILCTTILGTSSWHHDILYMGPVLHPAHLSPVSLYNTPPHGEYTLLLSPPVTCRVDNSSWWWFWMWEDFPVGFLILNLCNWVNMPYCLNIDVFMFTGTVWSCILLCLRSFIGRCGFLLHP